MNYNETSGEEAADSGYVVVVEKKDPRNPMSAIVFKPCKYQQAIQEGKVITRHRAMTLNDAEKEMVKLVSEIRKIVNQFHSEFKSLSGKGGINNKLPCCEKTYENIKALLGISEPNVFPIGDFATLDIQLEAVNSSMSVNSLRIPRTSHYGDSA